MLRNYFRIACRNLLRSKGFTVINILGLALGMAVAILIGLWITDEISFDRQFPAASRNVQLMHHWNNNAFHKISTESVMPVPAANELRTKYGSYFSYVALSRRAWGRIFSDGSKKITRNGMYAEKDITGILSLQLLSGSTKEQEEPNTVLISRSSAQAVFGSASPVGQLLKVDNKNTVKVTGVYEDFPRNTSFYGVDFILPWSYLVADQSWVKRAADYWNDNSFTLYAKLAPNADFEKAATAIKYMLRNRPDRNDNAVVFMHPMLKWHLYDEFDHGVNTGGAIKYLLIFGLVGFFVLVLACINFMNLNTARSQNRSKEVGIRKAIGSGRKQLILQFLGEAVMMAAISMIIALVLVYCTLPWFNQVAEKEIHFPFISLYFWTSVLLLVGLTGILAGSYPAFYLSSFNTIKVLKGAFKPGKQSAYPRKLLVIFQFSISVALMTGTVLIIQQVNYARERPLGYEQNGLINIAMTTPDLYGKYDLLRRDLISSGAAVNMAEASNPAGTIFSHLSGFDWPGKEEGLNHSLGVSWVTHDFGSTVGWKFVAGRDFSRSFATDSSAIILNERAVAFMGLKDPVNTMIRFNQKPYLVVGVIKDVIMESPFAQAAPIVFMMDYNNASDITIKLNPALTPHQALTKVEKIFKQYNPNAPFDYRFINDEFNNKFKAEEKAGRLTLFFAILAIFISCMGIFGLATFMADQRTREIGIRKVLGATVLELWATISGEFLVLTVVSFVVAAPLIWVFIEQWLNGYEYRMKISIWTFLVIAILTLMITLCTISYQALKAAMANPSRSLKTQ
ncbi:ABC transporter permease [Chitinophaga sp. Cy-1792]|uniref:ABC transporter permease n=1 Tax=Chitinophaga sp. Cy-1792 TaxID=2608339 RepID=UPI00141FDAB2|nr:ABC transporter permease [Chitinophaga sp. Cy-1792]NIG55786.1 FtsX-like permease family protein [Chitinophaga sp. Cy-1792]